jgi:hypothetical protein
MLKLLFVCSSFVILIATITVSGSVNVAEAKNTYKLVVYLDGAFDPNNLHSFNVTVYSSDHKNMISDKITPDFSDNHQKIGTYEIMDKAKQHPNQIKVCAQQGYGLDGKLLTHDDCFKIKQNKAKTYYYTTFDYPLLEGYEGD